MSEKENDDLFTVSSGAEQAPLVSAGRDLRKLRKNSAATAAELKALLAQMKGKSTGEVLGTVAASDFGKSLIAATAGALVLIVVFTVVPYGWGLVAGGGDGGAGGEGAATADKLHARGEGAGEGQGEAEPAGEEEAQAEEVVEVNLLNGGETVEKLGIGETMEAPVDVNPLEGATDDLLKDLD